jgi:hypothetical protein
MVPKVANSIIAAGYRDASGMDVSGPAIRKRSEPADCDQPIDWSFLGFLDLGPGQVHLGEIAYFDVRSRIESRPTDSRSER